MAGFAALCAHWPLLTDQKRSSRIAGSAQAHELYDVEHRDQVAQAQKVTSGRPLLLDARLCRPGGD